MSKPAQAAISLVLVNGLANRLRALRSALDMVDQFESHHLQFTWPHEPGVCEVRPEELFNNQFLSNYYFIPSEREQSWLKEELKGGLHFYPRMNQWGLNAQWAREEHFWPSVESQVLDTRESIFIITGGLLGAKPERRLVPESFNNNLRKLDPWSRNILSEVNLAKKAAVEVGFHLRFSDRGGLFPSVKAFRKAITREIGPDRNRVAYLATDSPNQAIHYARVIKDLDFQLVTLPSSPTVLRSELRDFARLSQVRTLFTVHWSTFAQEALISLGHEGSNLVRLKRPLLSHLFRLRSAARRIIAALMSGRARFLDRGSCRDS